MRILAKSRQPKLLILNRDNYLYRVKAALAGRWRSRAGLRLFGRSRPATPQPNGRVPKRTEPLVDEDQEQIA
ncbi:hypothetical protein [Streptosporangium sp. 'caverna']|uniref:hypothetical protein n=1 Tax=Streptosporangium sp. 'caverna' TaxID=2202249 RepID=UPI000D7D2F0F|nr:hypothetical protein [Streptosporangium sp. 'caverna']AWS44086.1 hypothetical protein DKM19_24785 [Streptosporangium sp. 'caverna']